MQIQRQSFYEASEIFLKVRNRVEQIIANKEKIDYLAFVPDGEPTLDTNLGKTIDLLKDLNIPIAVISNASLINDKQVQKDLEKTDWLSLKVDAANKEVWHKIDRPHGKLNFEQIKEGMLAFRINYKGIFATETMLINGVNDSEEEINDIGLYLKRLQPDICYLSIPTRPPAEKNVRPAVPENINRAYQIINSYVEKVELITGYEGNTFSSSGDIYKDILNITSVHPMRKDAIEVMIGGDNSKQKIFNEMVKKEEIIYSEFDGYGFYMRNFKNKITY
jgi:wyosine [tRNA(Phe)-imidazoG37] synthetase (radical SAM superfamily)